jgi:pimeloyl-[acyl-carrier protein] methyl ester esterase
MNTSLKIGDTAYLSRRYTPEDIRDFAKLAGIDPAGITSVPEPLIAALFSYLLGVKLPGRGTNYLKQELCYLKPAGLDEELTARVTVTKLRPEKHLCDLGTVLTNTAGEILATGRALVSIRDAGTHPALRPELSGFARIRSIGEGKPLVFLHGWSANADFFEAQHTLARQGFRLILPDLPGHGPNATPNPRLTIPDLAAALAEYLAAEKLERPVLVGWSMGASVALDYLGRKDALPVGGLVILDMTPKVANTATWRCGLANGQGEAEMRAAAAEMEREWKAFAPRIGKALFARNRPADPDAVRQASEAFAANDPATMASLWRSLALLDCRATLSTLPCPVLAIMGAASRIYGPDLADWYRTQGPVVAVISVENAGHAPHIEQPEVVNAAIADFAARLSSAVQG